MTIKLEDGREILVQDSLETVNRAIKAALRSDSTLQIDTPGGPIFINPRQIQSFAEDRAADRVAEPA